MEETTKSIVPIGCDECPNRTKANKTTLASLALGLLFAGLAFSYSYEWKSEGGFLGWHPKEDPPVIVWGALFPLAIFCLGVPIPQDLLDRRFRAS